MALPDFPMPPELAVDFEPVSEHDLIDYFIHGPGDAEALTQPQHYTDEAVRSARVHAWRIEAYDQAEWALRKAAVATEELRQLQEQAAEWAARIQGWFDNAARTHQRTVDYMTERLEDFGLRVRDAGGPATLHFPSGSIKTTETKPAVVVADDERLGSWLKNTVTVDDLRAAFGEDSEQWPEVWKSSVKVYVGPLRKLVQVVEVPDGKILTEELECGHTVTYDFLGGPEDIPSPGSKAACRTCPVDSIEGEQWRAIVSAEVTPRTRLVVMSPGGELVPGAEVKPGEVTAKVVVG